MPDPRLPRRGFLGLTAATVATLSTTRIASANPQHPIDYAAGPVGDRVLARRDGTWILTDPTGNTTSTAGLTGADITAVTQAPDGYVAVGSQSGKAVIWESPDGTTWIPAQRRNDPHATFTATGTGPSGVLALGSLLSPEGTPHRPVAAIRTQSRDWLTLPIRGLTNHHHITAVTGAQHGWTAAAVDQSGSTTYHSPDGTTWTEGTRVTASAIRELAGETWTGNALDDTAPVRGVLGHPRELANVPRDAHAVGGGFWLTNGRIVREAR